MIQAERTVMKKNAKAMMLGVGLDSDGHKRVTKGSNFSIVGGSKETHEVMTEKVIKINEKLSKKGRIWIPSLALSSRTSLTMSG